jgi:hypothetical protein
VKKLTPSNYAADTMYPRVVRAIGELLAAGHAISAPAIFVKMGMLSEANLRLWRDGRVPYLERVIAGSLGKTSRVLRIMGLRAHDLGLSPVAPHTAGNIKFKGRALRFSKTGERGVEDAYKRIFVARPPRGRAREAGADDPRGAGGAVEQGDEADER